MLNEPLESPIAFAHRGYSPDRAENSMAAFTAAVDLGYGYLETDARVTADGIAVAFHDYLLDRVTTHTGRLADLRWDELSRVRIRGREPIPRLADVLTALPDTRFNIDVKCHAAVGPTLDAIRQAAAWHRVRLAAFSHPRCLLLRGAAGPAVGSALSPREILALKLTERHVPPVRRAPVARAAPLRARWHRLGGARAASLPADVAAQVPAGPRHARLVTAAFVAAAHSRGFPVHVWTVNDPGEMTRLLDLGVDGIISDRADLLRDVLRGRGHWPG